MASDRIDPERAARDRDMVDAIREILGLDKLYGPNGAGSEVSRFGARTWGEGRAKVERCFGRPTPLFEVL